MVTKNIWDPELKNFLFMDSGHFYLPITFEVKIPE